jgi:hypothetical protein
LIELNPFHRWIDPFRLALYSPGLPHSDAATAFTQSLLLSTLVSLIFLAAAAGFWSTRRNSVYLNV